LSELVGVAAFFGMRGAAVHRGVDLLARANFGQTGHRPVAPVEALVRRILADEPT
jgi:hypothetical protein